MGRGRANQGPWGRCPLNVGGGIGRLCSFLAGSTRRLGCGSSHGHTTVMLCPWFTRDSPQGARLGRCPPPPQIRKWAVDRTPSSWDTCFLPHQMHDSHALPSAIRRREEPIKFSRSTKRHAPSYRHADAPGPRPPTLSSMALSEERTYYIKVQDPPAILTSVNYAFEVWTSGRFGEVERDHQDAYLSGKTKSGGGSRGHGRALPNCILLLSGMGLTTHTCTTRYVWAWAKHGLTTHTHQHIKVWAWAQRSGAQSS